MGELESEGSEHVQLLHLWTMKGLPLKTMKLLALCGGCFCEISGKYQEVGLELLLVPSQKEDLELNWRKVRTNMNLLHLSLNQQGLLK